MVLSASVAQTIAEMDTNHIMSWILVIVVVGGIFIEISPIKINPLSALAAAIFKPINDKIDTLQTDVDKNMGEMKESINKISSAQDHDRFSTIRWEILNFRNDINNGVLFTEKEYSHIFEDYTTYQELHSRRGFQNSQLDDAIDEIKTHYNDHKNLNAKYF